MKIGITKLILWDFVQVLQKREGVRSFEKIRYVLHESVSKGMKVIFNIIFFWKLRDAESTLRVIAEMHGWEEVACNLCGSRDYTAISEKKGFRAVKCSNCGLIFVTPRLNRNGREWFYSSKYRFWVFSLFCAFNKLDLAVSERFSGDQILATILTYKRNGNLIEIGPFGKEVTKIAGRKGFRCWRLKSNAWAYDSPIEEREYVRRDTYGSTNGRQFDVVSCLDILDRIPDPSRELNGLYRILKDDGVLVIRVPSYSTITGEEKGTTWHYNRPWERIYQFDYPWLRDLLDNNGFKIIDLKTELSDGVGSPGCIILVAMKKNWRIKAKSPRILLIREGAAGDVLLTTPIVKEVKKKFPDCYLMLFTKYPEILRNNPYVDEIIGFGPKDGIDVVFNLMYELYPDTPIVQAYGKITQVFVEHPQIEFYLSDQEREWIDRFMKTLFVQNDERYAVIHPMAGNRIKWWNPKKYQAVSDYIRSRELKVLTIGSPVDCVALEDAINLIGKLSLRQSSALISRARLLIGLDSYPMHVANAFKIPSVILFGSTAPREVLVDARNVKIIQSSEYCLGCRRHTTPDRWKQNARCRRGQLHCMESISADRVIRGIEEMLDFSKHEGVSVSVQNDAGKKDF